MTEDKLRRPRRVSDGGQHWTLRDNAAYGYMRSGSVDDRRAHSCAVPTIAGGTGGELDVEQAVAVACCVIPRTATSRTSSSLTFTSRGRTSARTNSASVRGTQFSHEFLAGFLWRPATTIDGFSREGKRRRSRFSERAVIKTTVVSCRLLL